MMTPKEELVAAANYLRKHSLTGFRNMPEKTVAGVLNGLSPEARAHSLYHKTLTDNFIDSAGREMPFQPKRYLDDLDLPAAAVAVMNQAHTEELSHDLTARMGTQPIDEPTTLRDVIDASFDSEGGHHD